MVFGRLVDELQAGMTVDAQDWEGLSEIDILHHWTKNVSNLDVELPENCASFVSLFCRLYCVKIKATKANNEDVIRYY